VLSGRASASLRSFRESLALLATRRFGTFWFASLLSSIGTWAQQVAEPWLLLTLGASPFLIGLDSFATDAPVWLLTLVGGPSAVRRMIQAKRLGEIRFGPGERQLQAGTAGLTWQPAYAIGNAFQIARSRLSPDARKAALDRYVADPPDGAAPLAIADALARLARGEILSETSTRILLDTMASSVTGRARLRAALPPGWKIAHKTGTGQDLGARNAGFNDVGLLTAPDGRRYALAVMIGDSTRPIRERQMLIQAAAAALTQYVQAHPSNAAGLNSLQ